MDQTRQVGEKAFAQSKAQMGHEIPMVDHTATTPAF